MRFLISLLLHFELITPRKILGARPLIQCHGSSDTVLPPMGLRVS